MKFADDTKLECIAIMEKDQVIIQKKTDNFDNLKIDNLTLIP